MNISWLKAHHAAPLVLSAPATSTIGSAVQSLDRAYQTTVRKCAALEAEIDSLVEELRQSRAVVKSIEAAMTVVCADPALFDDEKEKAAAVVNAAIDKAVDLEEITNVR